MENKNVQTKETPLIIKIFTLFALCGFMGYLIGGIIEFINFPVIGIVYLITSLYFCIIFIGLLTEKKWSIFLLFILFLANFVYSVWINFNQLMNKYGYISLGLMAIIFIVIIYLLTREDVKAYFNQ